MRAYSQIFATYKHFSESSVFVKKHIIFVSKFLFPVSTIIEEALVKQFLGIGAHKYFLFCKYLVSENTLHKIV